MCGICGKLAFDPQAQVDTALVRRMMDAIQHRGPDDQGIYDGGPVVLGHRRLSIIDLNTGQQPISNEDGSITLVYNGEVYNFREIRDWLVQRGHAFKTQTDTEVIVHLYEEYGEECVGHLQGMFAFALWDAPRRKLLLARDRVGIKPLYYASVPDGVVFGSEIKSLLLDSGLKREVDPHAVSMFLTYLYLPGELTMFPQVKKLEPGHYLVVENGGLKTTQYWDLFPARQTSLSLEAATEQLRGLLAGSVRRHMIADVPVGVLLSGGVDSTGVLSYAAEETGKPVHAFTIGFAGENFADERPYARLAAEKYGAVMHELTIGADEFRDFLPRYVWHMEEPVCEPPAVALYYISRLASRHVKVLLSGEGGDEAFAGYQNYRNLVWLERFKKAGTEWTNAATAAVLRNMPGPLRRLRKYALPMQTPLADYYFSRTAAHSPFDHLRDELLTAEFRQHLNGHAPHKFTRDLFSRVQDASPLNQMLYVDTKTWLPDDLLVKADKMTMANSVELRVPLLDHTVLEFAATLPESFKVRRFTTKYILKRALQERVPREILNRPKTGFPVPFASWIKNELRDFVTDTLTSTPMRNRGYFNRDSVDKMLSSEREPDKVFSLLVLELWHREFLERRPVTA